MMEEQATKDDSKENVTPFWKRFEVRFTLILTIINLLVVIHFITSAIFGYSLGFGFSFIATQIILLTGFAFVNGFFYVFIDKLLYRIFEGITQINTLIFSLIISLIILIPIYYWVGKLIRRKFIEGKPTVQTIKDDSKENVTPFWKRFEVRFALILTIMNLLVVITRITSAIFGYSPGFGFSFIATSILMIAGVSFVNRFFYILIYPILNSISGGIPQTQELFLFLMVFAQIGSIIILIPIYYWVGKLIRRKFIEGKPTVQIKQDESVNNN